MGLPVARAMCIPRRSNANNVNSVLRTANSLQTCSHVGCVTHADSVMVQYCRYTGSEQPLYIHLYLFCIVPTQRMGLRGPRKKMTTCRTVQNSRFNVWSSSYNTHTSYHAVPYSTVERSTILLWHQLVGLALRVFDRHVRRSALRENKYLR